MGEAGIGYARFEELGGRRRPLADSPNRPGATAPFAATPIICRATNSTAGSTVLLEMAGRQRTAMMCAEVLWWRCHRSLVSDVLKTRGIEVLHIGRKPPAAHPFTAPARWSTAS